MKRKMALSTLLLFMLLTLNSCFFRSKVPLIGVLANGQESLDYIPLVGLGNQTGKFLNELDIKTRRVLEKNSLVTPSWELKKVFVGLGLSGSAGLPPITSLDGSMTLFLYWER